MGGKGGGGIEITDDMRAQSYANQRTLNESQGINTREQWLDMHKEDPAWAQETWDLMYPATPAPAAVEAPAAAAPEPEPAPVVETAPVVTGTPAPPTDTALTPPAGVGTETPAAGAGDALGGAILKPPRYWTGGLDQYESAHRTGRGGAGAGSIRTTQT